MAGHWACPACGAVVPDAEDHSCSASGTVWDKATADRITGVMVATAEWEATQAVVAAARKVVSTALHGAAYGTWTGIPDERMTALRAALARLDGAGREDGR